MSNPHSLAGKKAFVTGGKRRIGAGANGDMFVAFRRRLGVARVYADNARAIPLARFVQEMPMVVAGGQHVRAPQDDELGMNIFFRIEADRVAGGHHGEAGRAANVADHV